METDSNNCPTGILIDVGLQTKTLNIKENEDKASIKSRKDKNVVTTNSSCEWTSNCFLDQSPPTIVKKNVFCTPKSNWKTPSPKSMKIISRDASRIVDQLYSSPINCTEVMIYDEVFPAINYLDDACCDEFHSKSENLDATDMNVAPVKRSQNLNNCQISAAGSCSSKSVVASKENVSAIVLQSDMKPEKELDSISEEVMGAITSENASTRESVASDKEMVKSVTCVVNSVPTVPEDTKVSSEEPLAPELQISKHKKLLTFAKGFGFKKSVKNCPENNKENEHQSNKTRQANHEPTFSNVEKSCNSNKNKTNETKVKKNQILKEEYIAEQSSTKCTTSKYSVLENKNSKSKLLTDDLSKNMTEKSKTLQQKSNIGRSKSLLYKKGDPLSKTVTLLGTPIVASPIRRIRSFHDGSTKKAIPTVEKKLISTAESSCRISKPRMSLNQVPNNGNSFTTPLQFGRYSKSSKLMDPSSTNPIRRKSLAFNPNNSLVASGVKVAAQGNEHSITKKLAVTSSRIGFGKLDTLSSRPNSKKDNLPRKLFS